MSNVKIHHPGLDTTVTVRDRAVAAWAHAGWQPVEQVPTTDDPAPEPGRYLVLAGTRDDAMAWAREHDVVQKAVTYASTPDVVSAVDPIGLAVVELDSFAGHRHEDDIRAAVTAVFTPTTQPAPAGEQDAAAAGQSTADTQE